MSSANVFSQRHEHTHTHTPCSLYHAASESNRILFLFFCFFVTPLIRPWSIFRISPPRFLRLPIQCAATKHPSRRGEASSSKEKWSKQRGSGVKEQPETKRELRRRDGTEKHKTRTASRLSSGGCTVIACDSFSDINICMMRLHTYWKCRDNLPKCRVNQPFLFCRDVQQRFTCICAISFKPLLTAI